MRRYITYKRVSSETGQEWSRTEAQERDIQLFLENYADTPYEVLEEFVEVHSGSDNDRATTDFCYRPGEEGERCLVVAKLDRLACKVSSSLLLWKRRDWSSGSPRCPMRMPSNSISTQHSQSKKNCL